MVTVTYFDSSFEGAFAAKNEHEFMVYDNHNKIIHHIMNIWDEEWDEISIEGGTWLDPLDVPTEADALRADIDYMTMENEFLEEENALLRADLDFCLMLIGED